MVQVRPSWSIVRFGLEHELAEVVDPIGQRPGLERRGLEVGQPVRAGRAVVGLGPATSELPAGVEDLLVIAPLHPLVVGPARQVVAQGLADPRRHARGQPDGAGPRPGWPPSPGAAES